MDRDGLESAGKEMYVLVLLVESMLVVGLVVSLVVGLLVSLLVGEYSGESGSESDPKFLNPSRNGRRWSWWPRMKQVVSNLRRMVNKANVSTMHCTRTRSART